MTAEEHEQNGKSNDETIFSHMRSCQLDVTAPLCGLHERRGFLTIDVSSRVSKRPTRVALVQANLPLFYMSLPASPLFILRYAAVFLTA